MSETETNAERTRPRCDSCGRRWSRRELFDDHGIDLAEGPHAPCPACGEPLTAVVEVRDYLEALAALTPASDGVVRLPDIALEALADARAHLTKRLRAHLLGAPAWRTEQQAAAYIKGLGLDLHRAAAALLECAEAFRRSAAAPPAVARKAFEAHKAAAAKAHEVLG
jgi:hypothetical protein